MRKRNSYVEDIDVLRSLTYLLGRLNIRACQTLYEFNVYASDRYCGMRWFEALHYLKGKYEYPEELS